VRTPPWAIRCPGLDRGGPPHRCFAEAPVGGWGLVASDVGGPGAPGDAEKPGTVDGGPPIGGKLLGLCCAHHCQEYSGLQRQVCKPEPQQRRLSCHSCFEHRAKKVPSELRCQDLQDVSVTFSRTVDVPSLGGGMAANERLRAAMGRARVTADQLARAAAVDQKTVYRWLSSTDRIPHPRTRWSVAKLLGEDEQWLWPDSNPAPAAETGASGELVTAYAYRSEAPTSLWWELITRTTRQIDLLGYTLYFLTLQHPELLQSFTDKCAAGCRIRVLIGDPNSPHVAYRDEEEGTPLNLGVRIQTTLAALSEVMECDGFELRYQNIPLYNSVFRFDDQMFVTPHLYATVGSKAPMLHLRRLGTGGLFDRFVSHFEAVWANSKSES
jgi:hypothetical protein